MKLITKIEVRDVSEEYHFIYHFDPQHVDASRNDPERQKVERELVHGKYFVNNRGEEICIGTTKEVQELIGLPFEAFTTLYNQLQDAEFQYKECSIKRTDLENKISTASFWQRLKYLFTKQL